MSDVDKKPEEGKGSDNVDGAGEKTPILGKFKTQDELVKSYQELERALHEKSQEVSTWKQSVAEMMEARGNTEDVNREEVDAEDFSQQFIENPKATFEAWGQKLTDTVTKKVGKYLDVRDTVSNYLKENPDLETNPMLFAMHMARTNPKAQTMERLTAAAELYRADIEKIRKEERDKKAAEKEYEAKNKKKGSDMGGHGRDAPAKSKKKDDDDAGDFSYEAYIKERKKARARITGGLL